MEIILLEQIPSLGGVGEVVEVKNGFARNCLLPQKRAMRATKANLAYFQEKRGEIEKRNLAATDAARGTQQTLEGREVLAVRQASESGRLYGSVTPKDIIALLGEDGVERSQIVLSKPVREIGIHRFVIRLHAEVEAKLLLNVARSEDEAKTQSARHHAPPPTEKSETEKSGTEVSGTEVSGTEKSGTEVSGTETAQELEPATAETPAKETAALSEKPTTEPKA